MGLYLNFLCWWWCRRMAVCARGLDEVGDVKGLMCKGCAAGLLPLRVCVCVCVGEGDEGCGEDKSEFLLVGCTSKNGPLSVYERHWRSAYSQTSPSCRGGPNPRPSFLLGPSRSPTTEVRSIF
jgi:hypothetical protein